MTRPELGYAVADNLLLGLGASYNYNKSEFDSSFDYRTTETNSFGFTPYIEKFFPLNSDFALSVRGEVRYLFGNSTFGNNSNASESDTNSFFIGFRPGINYFVSERVFLQANFGALEYDSIKNEDDFVNVNKSNGFGLNLNTSSLFFGINILL
ncbi:outer membrane beta-barrel protein [Psychroflexus tropicus]|uniref:outer membrane beta-barrel protein n=1 Tax=Psychroflexus tropicus TaxID=197345 RepID=UPI000381F23D|nr:outer membrane beta-barrel protein [Psychroflexus tropicus]